MDDRLAGPLRAAIPFFAAVLVQLGLGNEAAGFIAGTIVMVIAGAWLWYSNRPSAKAQSLAQETGVSVVVGPTAEPEMQAMARDPAVPGVVATPVIPG